MKPLWKGPIEDGITNSLLSRWLVCPERFRLKVIEGKAEDEGFRPALEYGSLWHEAEEAFAMGQDWKKAVGRYRTKLRMKYPTDEAAINKWSTLCLHQFPLYVNHWAGHRFTKQRKPILAEESFRVPYKLPSGRTIVLRGKFDAVWTWSKSIKLQENKVKGERSLDEEGIQKTLGQNLQTMLYQIALREMAKGNGNLDGWERGPYVPAGVGGPKPGWFFFKGDDKIWFPKMKVKGVIYNVIRRPLSDRHAIRQRKTETEKAFLLRERDRIEKDQARWFMRWDARVDDADVDEFKTRVFHPMLERFLDWAEWIAVDPFDPWTVKDERRSMRPGIHYQFPFGVYNGLAQGFRGDFFEYLTSGSRQGLEELDTLFPELV